MLQMSSRSHESQIERKIMFGKPNKNNIKRIVKTFTIENCRIEGFLKNGRKFERIMRGYVRKPFLYGTDIDWFKPISGEDMFYKWVSEEEPIGVNLKDDGTHVMILPKSIDYFWITKPFETKEKIKVVSFRCAETRIYRRKSC